MPNLVEITDFVGYYEIAQDKFTLPRFTQIRDEKQFELIYKVMGAELGEIFIADLDGSGEPVTQRFIDLYEPFQEDQATCDSEIVISDGIKKMVTAYVYFYWVSDNKGRVGISGNTQSEGQNSAVNKSNQFIVERYNKALQTGKAIQWFIGENLTDYPEYKGVELKYLMLF